MATVHDATVDVEAEVARAARLLLDLDRYADRIRDQHPHPHPSRLAALDAHLDALRRLLSRLVEPPG